MYGLQEFISNIVLIVRIFKKMYGFFQKNVPIVRIFLKKLYGFLLKMYGFFQKSFGHPANITFPSGFVAPKIHEFKSRMEIFRLNHHLYS